MSKKTEIIILTIMCFILTIAISVQIKTVSNNGSTIGSSQSESNLKAQVLQMLLDCGIHPLIATKTCGLWTDAEKVFLLSKEYMDVLYKTIDEEIEKQNLQSELEKAQKLIEEYEKKQAGGE